ncbi:hypothetical protein MMC25_003162 [Agyrium rufum]|nr:hypothetical protein [Agyrium rufum]
MQFDVFWSLKDDIPPKSAIALLSYSLATTGALYPTQLRQAAGCLEYLIGPGGKKAENILIGGDSAGGNLCASLLSHLVHPHPDIAPVQLNRPLAGAALVSPWGNFAHDADAYTRNQYKDSWDAPALSKCAEVYLGDAKPDEWNQPFRAKAEWWTDISSKVRDILITGGSEEVMADDITAFAKKIEVNHSSTTTTVVSGEVHDQAFMDPLFFDNRQAASTKLFKEWVKARL